MVFEESALKDLYRRVIWGPYRRTLQRLPHGLELRVNRGLGRVIAVGAKGKRARVVENLRRAFDDGRDLDAIAATTFKTHFMEQYISWSFSRMTPETIPGYVDLRGRHHLDAALEQGRGAVLMHPHMGPAQMPLAALGVLGYPMNQIGGGGVAHELSPAGQRAEAMRHEFEEAIRAKIWDGSRSLRGVVRALSRGEVVLSAIDGTGGGKELGRRLEREVLGQKMRVPVGAVYLAWRTGAPLMPLCSWFEGGRVVSEIHAPVVIPRDSSREVVLEAGADLVAEWLGRFLSEHPGDWHFWDEFEPGRFLVG